MQLDPQNPYRSCVVRASAGSGKTYQLSRRFLFLVGAGAHPASILTVTFTKKAAGEMRERILDSAAQLLSDPSEQEAFDRRLRDYYQKSEHRLYRPRPPRSALATAEAVLASTQSLRIATIDAVLLEWMKKFPFEAGSRGSLAIPVPFDLLSAREEERLHRKAWYLAAQSLASDPRLAARWNELRTQGLHLLDLELRIRELGKHESFLWLLQKQRDAHVREGGTLLPHPLPEESWDASPSGFLRSIEGSLASVCRLLAPAKQEAALEALARRDLETLFELRILSKSWEIHNGTFRRPKRDPYEEAIGQINEQARALRSYQARSALNELGAFLLEVYELYEAQLQKSKYEMGRLGFSDLIKGGYHLFNRPEAAGVRFLLHRTIRHLLLDEFQDTSILQWSMFNAMAAEMLAGEGLKGPDELSSTLFIVGDAKQSIYGFREAEAEVLQEAARFMLSREAWDISLSASYRTAPTLLRYINQVFEATIPDFPLHSTAEKQPGVTFVPGAASLTIGPLFLEEDVALPVAEEARFVAKRLRHLLDDSGTLPLWDKEKGTYRRLEARDCAILYRAATHSATYAEALRSEDIAARLEEGHSFFQRPEILDLMAFCRWMSLPSHTEAFVHFMKSPLFRMQDSALINALYREPGRDMTRYERHLRILDQLEDRYPSDVADLRRLLRERHISKPQSLLRRAADEGAWTQAYQKSFGAEEGALAAANLARFFETISDLEAQGYDDWIPLVQKLDELASEKAISLASVSENAVQLMTIHKAKGLEFPLVVLVGTGEEWEKIDPYWAKIKESQLGSGMAYVGRRSDRPDEDAHFEKIENILRKEAQQENLRLLYVALTRAQYHLLITGHQRKRYAAGFYAMAATAAESLGAETLAWQEWSLRSWADAPRGAALPSAAAESAAPPQPLPLPLSELTAWKTPLAPWGAIKILAPARLLEGAESMSSSYPSHPYATAIGTFIHRGLEALIKGLPFDREEVWSSLSDGSQAFAESLPLAAQKLDKLWQAPLLQELLGSALQCRAEWSIAFLSGPHLVRGTIDLLVQRNAEDWLVVDYKTSEESLHATDLKAYAAAKRYDQQLQLYMQGVRLLYPEARVEGAILFTEPLKLLTYS